MSSPNVPYQAYRSKRHSRTVSNTQLEHSVSVSPSPQSRRSSTHLSPHIQTSPTSTPPVRNGDAIVYNVFDDEALPAQTTDLSPERVIPVKDTHPAAFVLPVSSYAPPQNPSDHERREADKLQKDSSLLSTSPVSPNGSVVNGARPPIIGTIDTEAGPSKKPESNQRRPSTFKHIPLRPSTTTTLRTPSLLRPDAVHRRNLSTTSSPLPSEAHRRTSSSLASHTVAPSPITRSSSLQAPPIMRSTSSTSNASFKSSPLSSAMPTPTTITAPEALLPLSRSSSTGQPTMFSPSSPSSRGPSSLSNSRMTSPSPSQAPMSLSPTPDHVRTASPSYRTTYRPGFQPKGVYRPVTDDFLEFRTKARETGRIERTRLERRFEKLVDLHFSDEHVKTKENEKQMPQTLRRASSIFDLDLKDLRTKGAAELWRSVVDSRPSTPNVSKGGMRAAEQKITPWQDDRDVSACPHCLTAFHPLTNRKHHCRLCGRIICSLPPKQPQRPVPCSLLFVVDQKTGRIEEVSEGVDYGVRARKSSTPQGGGLSEEGEKFLKGVRICKECKSVMLRQQYRQEARRKPVFARLYEALIALEAEIEEALPQFQELILSLSNNTEDAPTKEATAARKRLLEAFAEYDALSKRIRKLPCPEGPGSSQDRVQTAILTRVNLFLQKNMFPLQSLPKPKKSSASPPMEPNDAVPVIDPDSELAHALQPLLEQEALLESFIEEAKAHRKFEDTKTLKTNLAEIRGEIERIVANAEGGTF